MAMLLLGRKSAKNVKLYCLSYVPWSLTKLLYIIRVLYNKDINVKQEFESIYV